jgi:rod shape determining protein RodA
MGRGTSGIDWLTAITLLVLAVFGLFILLTIDKSLFIQQGLFLVVGIILAFLVSRLDFVLLNWFAPFAYIFGNLLLAVSYLGPSIRGATRWIMLLGVQIQPSELVKPLLLLSFAWFISKFPPRNSKYIPLHLILFIIPFLLVYRQPDLGSSLIYALLWFSMMLAGGISLKLVLSGLVFLFLLLPGAWRVLAPYQKSRILTFINPALDPQGAGYNALQATIAIGSGQFFGKGLGLGTQSHLRFLPEFHTDFIFATLIEEVGFFGGIILLSVYVFLFIQIIRILWRETDNLFIFTYASGLFMMILSQIFINSGMNMGILPITGITLPFVSYGGSSLLSLAVSFGLLWGMQSQRKR